MDMLKLSIQAGLPLIHIRTDDIINVEEVLAYIAEELVTPLNIPEVIAKVEDFKVPKGRVFYTSSECKSLAKLYRFCVDNEKTIIFVNTEKSVLQFDGGTLFPPMEMVRAFLAEISDDPDVLLPAFGGMTLKDVGEVAKLTMTRDESLTVRGVNETRRGYSTLRGVTQVDTALSYYVCPDELAEWMENNANFFKSPVHPSLTPRGLLAGGPPGTGKTLASMYIAQEFGVPLYRLDLGTMMGKYVGDSENNLNAALAQVDQIEPCVVIFDEVEKVFQGNSDSGVTSRLLSQLLWWLQSHKSKVFTVMTTNAIGKIPEELYREGRIDVTLQFLGISSSKDGYEFARGAYDSMITEVLKETPGIKVDSAKAYQELNKRIKFLYADNVPIPQSKLTQMAYSLVRELVSQGGLK